MTSILSVSLHNPITIMISRLFNFSTYMLNVQEVTNFTILFIIIN